MVKKWIAGPAGEQDDLPLLHVPERAAADIGLRHARHRDRRLNPRIDPDALERILKRERVHHRRKHAHIICARPVEALGGGGHAAEDVAPADDEAQLVPLPLRFSDLAGEPVGGFGIDPELPLAHQRLARQLQQDPVEARAGHAA